MTFHESFFEYFTYIQLRNLLFVRNLEGVSGVVSVFLNNKHLPVFDPYPKQEV
jgi:hypothetical protein